MNAPRVNTVPIRLSQPENVKAAIENLEAKLMIIKRGIEEMLVSLDAQDKVSWPAFIAKCSSLASDLSTLQANLKKSLIPNANEDNGEFLKNQLILPHTISPDVNPELMTLTEGRVHLWNHETTPSFLRTKLTPALEEENLLLEREVPDAATTKLDQISKQITVMNKHLDQLANGAAEQMSRSRSGADASKIMFNNPSTESLVRALYGGEGMAKPSMDRRR